MFLNRSLMLSSILVWMEGSFYSFSNGKFRPLFISVFSVQQTVNKVLNKFRSSGFEINCATRPQPLVPLSEKRYFLNIARGSITVQLTSSLDSEALEIYYWNNNRLTCLFKFKSIKQEVSSTVVLPVTIINESYLP